MGLGSSNKIPVPQMFGSDYANTEAFGKVSGERERERERAVYWMEGAETFLFCGGERIEGAVTLSNHRHHLRPYS